MSRIFVKISLSGFDGFENFRYTVFFPTIKLEIVESTVIIATVIINTGRLNTDARR